MLEDERRNLLVIPFGHVQRLMKVVAKEDIVSGDEITISYVDPSWPGELRRETLKRNYGFDCQCQVCLAD